MDFLSHYKLFGAIIVMERVGITPNAFGESACQELSFSSSSARRWVAVLSRFVKMNIFEYLGNRLKYATLKKYILYCVVMWKHRKIQLNIELLFKNYGLRQNFCLKSWSLDNFVLLLYGVQKNFDILKGIIQSDN